MQLNANNSFIVLSVMYLGMTETKNDTIPLDQALKDPKRIDFIKRHLYRMSNAIKYVINLSFNILF